MKSEQAGVLRKFIADNWTRWVHHCAHHGLNEEEADEIYEQLEAEENDNR